jgi:hypothetical protein
MTTSIEQWKAFLVEINGKYLTGLSLKSSDSDMRDFFSSMERSLGKVTKDDVIAFLEHPNYSYYIPERISLNEHLHEEYILLAYFISRRFRVSTCPRWALGQNILQYIYSDLGISFPNHR